MKTPGWIIILALLALVGCQSSGIRRTYSVHNGHTRNVRLRLVERHVKAAPEYAAPQHSSEPEERSLPVETLADIATDTSSTGSSEKKLAVQSISACDNLIVIRSTALSRVMESPFVQRTAARKLSSQSEPGLGWYLLDSFASGFLAVLLTIVILGGIGALVYFLIVNGGASVWAWFVREVISAFLVILVLAALFFAGAGISYLWDSMTGT
jgi:hypothetical protein